MLWGVRYLITGGAGFIGSHLAEVLVERGDSVVALDNLSTGHQRNLETVAGHRNFRLVPGSVLDDLLLDDLVRECDVVVHLAAAVGVSLIVNQPLRSLRTNIRGTENVLEAVHRYRKTALVASTSEVYGKNSGTLSETSDRILGAPSIARWAYSTSKAVDEILALAYWRERQIPTIVVRFFNTVGPRQTGAYGMVIPRFVAQALRGDDLTVYGTGEQSRCFLDVSDCVRAVVALVDERRAIGEVFNIGSTEEVTIAALASRVIDAIGSSSGVRKVEYADVYGDQYEDMLRRVPDTSKIRSLIGWAPERNLDDVIKRTTQWAEHIGPDALLEA